jgi:CBS domain containing-hemolysin-like protein
VILELLHHYLTPLLAAGFGLWAAWLALAAEAEADLPRVLADQIPLEKGALSASRGLYVAHLALLVLASAAAATAVSWWLWAPVGAAGRLLVATGMIWVIGTSLPRLIAALAPELPEAVRPGALRTLVVFRPLLTLLAWADARVKVRRAPRSPGSERSGAGQRDMLFGLFSLADTTVAEVMTPRLDIVAVDASSSSEEVVTAFRNSEHARLLVYDGQSDAVAGVLYAKDMLASLSRDEDEPWQALIRPSAFVPEGKTLDRQLRDFQRGPAHLAVVVDEFGGTAGLVTLEDILEQIIGEIRDEYDTDEVAPIQAAPDGTFEVDGGVALSELEGILGRSFGREDVSTVGGLVLAELGHVPKSGEEITLDGYRFRVDQVARRRIRRVRVAPPVAEQSAVEAEAAPR